MKNVIKRDGTVVSFDGSKIVNAICSAMERTVSVDRALAAHIAVDDITYYIINYNNIKIAIRCDISIQRQHTVST